MQLPFRYELGFIPATIDGMRHKLKVKLTRKAHANYRGVPVRLRPEYTAAAERQAWALIKVASRRLH